MSDKKKEITRVDMFVIPNGIRIVKYPEGWTASTREASDHVNTENTLDEMLEWFVAYGWTIKRWATGARAFKGRALPVRTRWGIQYMRNLYRERPWLLGEGDQLHAVDFAFCY